MQLLRSKFDATLTELDYQTFDQPIVRNNAESGFEILKNRDNDASRRHIPRRRATINNPSWINNDVKQGIGRRERAYEAKKRSIAKKLLQNTLKQGIKLKELLNRENAIRN